MTKACFLLNLFKKLELDVKALAEKSDKGVNGNALNALVRKYENLAYDTDLWWNGEVSEHMFDKDLLPRKIQSNAPNFRNIINRRLHVHLS